MKKLALFFTLMFCFVAAVASAQVTAVVDGQEFSAESFQALTTAALASGSSLTDTIVGVAGAKGTLQEIVAGALAGGVDINAIFAAALSLEIPAGEVIKSHMAAGVDSETIAEAARLAEVDPVEIASALGSDTPGLAYTPALAARTGNLIRAASTGVVGLHQNVVVSPSSPAL